MIRHSQNPVFRNLSFPSPLSCLADPEPCSKIIPRMVFCNIFRHLNCGLAYFSDW
ncbi:hypothetical protein L873DRAFT_1242899 [Choiromyces venosus 120613-1]|uniref:Uncharacterized protein n=1 Tax=Choiromyces venosus 120613-1 TaxID=1336337 RepID=A0A3N4JHT8_9PEZI|nr:hypothetical protein L873DRAFT_1242899 [Choiromyces venosus 120613-1]